jgi:hypothetical protein
LWAGLTKLYLGTNANQTKILNICHFLKLHEV